MCTDTRVPTNHNQIQTLLRVSMSRVRLSHSSRGAGFRIVAGSGLARISPSDEASMCGHTLLWRAVIDVNRRVCRMAWHG
jgi:hypothetical protein